MSESTAGANGLAEAAGYPPGVPPAPHRDQVPPGVETRLTLLAALLDAVPAGVLAVQARPRRAGWTVAAANATAVRLLGFDAGRGGSGGSAGLPPALVAWMVGATDPRLGRRAPVPLHCRHLGRRLRVRRLAALADSTAAGGPAGWVLEIVEQPAALAPAAPAAAPELAARLGLTPKRAQALALLLRGASNKEIALAMGTSVPRSKQHVQDLCAHFGTPSRLGTALAALRQLYGLTGHEPGPGR